jgi:hypothetical protein
MLQSQVAFSVSAYIDHDPAANDVLPIWICPSDVLGARLVAAKVIVANDVGASTSNYFTLNLLNGGTAGTATTSISGTIGGTAGWTGLLPVAFPLTTAGKNVEPGDVITLNYEETGTGTFTAMTVQLDFRYD